MGAAKFQQHGIGKATCIARRQPGRLSAISNGNVAKQCHAFIPQMRVCDIAQSKANANDRLRVIRGKPRNAILSMNDWGKQAISAMIAAKKTK